MYYLCIFNRNVKYTLFLLQIFVEFSYFLTQNVILFGTQERNIKNWYHYTTTVTYCNNSKETTGDSLRFTQMVVVFLIAMKKSVLGKLFNSVRNVVHSVCTLIVDSSCFSQHMF